MTKSSLKLKEEDKAILKDRHFLKNILPGLFMDSMMVKSKSFALNNAKNFYTLIRFISTYSHVLGKWN